VRRTDEKTDGRTAPFRNRALRGEGRIASVYSWSNRPMTINTHRSRSVIVLVFDWSLKGLLIVFVLRGVDIAVHFFRMSTTSRRNLIIERGLVSCVFRSCVLSLDRSVRLRRSGAAPAMMTDGASPRCAVVNRSRLRLQQLQRIEPDSRWLLMLNCGEPVVYCVCNERVLFTVLFSHWKCHSI